MLVRRATQQTPRISTEEYVDGTSFPWAVQPRQAPLAKPNGILGKLAAPFVAAAQRAFVENVAKSVWGDNYLQTSLILGTTLALKKFTAALSSSDRKSLQQMCEDKLYKRLDAELSKLEERGESIEVTCGKFLDTELLELLWVFGEKPSSPLHFHEVAGGRVFYETDSGNQVLMQTGSIGFSMNKRDLKDARASNSDLMKRIAESGTLFGIV
jgi:hypothetical protein